GMICTESGSRRGPRMSAMRDSTLADSERLIADLQRQLAECRAERDEALQRETATAEVLQVINSSPGDLNPVFEAIVEKALTLCEASEVTVRIFTSSRNTAKPARSSVCDNSGLFPKTPPGGNRWFAETGLFTSWMHAKSKPTEKDLASERGLTSW